MSEGEQAKPRRRRGRRRGRRAAGPAATEAGNGQVPGGPAKSTNAAGHADNSAPAAEAAAPGKERAKPNRQRQGRAGKGVGKGGSQGGGNRGTDQLRTVHETSAGGLVIDGIDGPRDTQFAALIGRVDRRGRMLWSLPKGHIEQGETAEQTAIREVAEETGIQGKVLAALGSIDYWFVTEGRRVHKTVHHYLLRFSGGELSDEDVEVTEVAWVPLHELPARLAYADERRLAEVAGELIHRLQTDGPASLPPLPQSAPRRRPQTHSRTRNRRPDESASGRTNGCGPSP